MCSFVSIGCPGRPFATADPTLDDFLPADDMAWDEGIVRNDDAVKLSSPMTEHMSKFALLCQAAPLLSQVLQIVSGGSTIEDDNWVALYAPLLHSHGSTDRSQRAKVVIQQITERVRENLISNRCFLNRNREDISPWGLFFVYHICAVHMDFSRDGASAMVVKGLKETFLAIDVRWNAAGVYLQLLEAREVLNNHCWHSDRNALAHCYVVCRHNYEGEDNRSSS